MSASAVRAAAEGIKAAVGQVDPGMLPTGRVCLDPGAQPSAFPAVIVGPPSLNWGGIGRPPTDAAFLVYVIADIDERAMGVLWDLTPVVAEAIDTYSEGVVTRADPGVYTVGGTDMPCYEITVEIGL